MTAPNPDYVVVRPLPRLGRGLSWSTLAAEIEQERLAALADLPVPHPLRDAYVALAEARTARAAGEPPVLADLPSRIDPVGHAAQSCDPVPAPPSRRGWLLRAIEGIFG